MRALITHPGASWSTADVFDGLCYGLTQHGVDVVPYRLDHRIEVAQKALWAVWRKASKINAATPKPTTADILAHAGMGALEMALRQQVDVVIVVSGVLLQPDVLTLMRRASFKVFVLFTESPYDEAHEVALAARADGCWTHERTSVEALQRVCPHAWYLPHGWHPERHRHEKTANDLPCHDVVFVGSGFPERITFFNRIDWTGIDLGLYGIWEGFGLKDELLRCIKSGPISNEQAAALYLNAKIGLNLYRSPRGCSNHGESLNPRAYELAACGCVSISQYRAESADLFSALVPTFETPQEAEVLIREWLTLPAARDAIAALLPERVAECSWNYRADQVIWNLEQEARSIVSGPGPDLPVAQSDDRVFEGVTADIAQWTSSPAWSEATP
jgi:hypothetical protein